MNAPLLIPWFRLEPIGIPFPFFGEIELQPFGALAAVAILVGARFAQARARQLGVADNDVSDFLLWTTAIGIPAAYVLNAVMYFPEELLEALSDPPRLVSRYWGLSSYGGFTGGLLAAIVFCRRRGLSLVAMGDVWCYAIPFAWIFARLGCFVVHDHPGAASDFILAVDNYDGKGIARHDLGLYEVLWALAAALFFHALGSRPRKAGYFLVWIPLLYGPMRFALDFLRANPIEGGDARYLGLTPAQYFSIALTLTGVVLLQAHLARWRHAPLSRVAR